MQILLSSKTRDVTMRCFFSPTGLTLISHKIVVIVVLLFSTAVVNAEPSVMNLQTGQTLVLESRMRLCDDARELRSILKSGAVHKIQVQCKNGAESLTVKVNGAETIYSIAHRKDYESDLSMELIKKLRSDQVEKYGQPDVETHKLPSGFSGEVWQYGWGKSCFIEPESERIAAGKSGGTCLVIDTDLTASKKLLVEYVEMTDMNFDPGYRSSKETDLELYSKEKGARMLDFSSASNSKADKKKKPNSNAE